MHFTASRFTTNDGLSRTTDLLNYNTPYTWMGWYRRMGASANQSLMISNVNTYTSQDCLGTQADGITSILSVWNDGAFNDSVGPVLAVGQDSHVVMVRHSATLVEGYLDGVLTFVNTRSIVGRPTSLRMALGQSVVDAGPCNMAVSASKAWSRALSLTEINRERFCVQPRSLVGLYGWWPFVPGQQTTDWSPNGRHLTKEGTVTTEAAAALLRDNEALSPNWRRYAAYAVGGAPPLSVLIGEPIVGSSIF